MSWVTAATRIGALLLSALVLGWIYGQVMWVLCAVLLGLVVYWLVQMHRVEVWLRNPEQPAPAIYGLWGNIVSHVYQQQKKSRLAREQLQSTVDYLQDSFASMRDGVAIVDDRGILKWFNQPAQLLLGLRSTDAGLSLMNVVRSPEFLRYFTRGEFGESLEYRSTGDAVTWLRVDITPFSEGDRLLFVRDISASVHMERVRRDFVANVSHELRTPLTVISGYLGTLLDDPDSLDSRLVKPMEQMLQQAQRMESLLSDLLLLARIESEQGLSLHTPVNICALLGELRDELQASEPERRIELVLDTDYEVPGEARELYSAVSNLLRNALKYSSPDTVVTVRWSQVDGGYHLAVTDRGTGIQKEHIPRLTERFYRVEDSRSSDTGGSGLGLAIVKHIAATHNARLQITSKPGRGSTFALVFPGQGQIGASRPLSLTPE